MSKSKKKTRGNIFITYFILFASIFLVTFAVLGTSLIFMVNSYSINAKTELLQENTESIAENISQTLIVNNMNADYSQEKAMICESLAVVSNCIDSDVYVCDNAGNIILCKEQIGNKPFYTGYMVCEEHSQFKMDDKIIQSVLENGTAISSAIINNESCYIVGTAIKAHDSIIGSVFAVVESGTTDLVESVIKMFIFVAIICLSVGFLMIWLLTKKMVTPLQQMSTAAKRFAVGDFSYRVNIQGNDELADLGIAFNDMADALDKLESSRRSFVANVSHELKTPMTSIAGFIDGILDGTIPKDKQDYYLKIVSGEVRRLSRLVVAMLNMSKMESGDFEMKPKNYNISDQIIHILLTFEQNIDKKHIEIRGLDSMQPHRVHADTDMIYQVVYNLFDNAVKFTNEGGYIAVNVTEGTEFVQVSIKNSGEGIKSQELAHLFERFYKVDKSRSLDASGAGLGLYIVKMMVEMHGGRIWAKSDSQSEAEFIFTLPRAK
ncbi:MAG: HAMP domain-containing histidine kinase [Ruminococcaceae bacterium]|nr:HAMP domain-containing histidine kinase [Oscillospiraceae bacterium]